MRLRINLQRILLTLHLAVRTRDNKLASSIVEFMEQFLGEDEYVTYTDLLLKGSLVMKGNNYECIPFDDG
jgi:hypothetical protein